MIAFESAGGGDLASRSRPRAVNVKLYTPKAPGYVVIFYK